MTQLILVDSQIWIYYFDPNAQEHPPVVRWFHGTKNDGALFTEEILFNAIIPLEIGHHLFAQKHLDQEKVEQFLISLISLKNSYFSDIDQFLIIETLKKLKILRAQGIGGRDCLLLATLDYFQANTIVTHDKNIIRLTDYCRIDPTLDPPLRLDVGM